MFNSKKGRDTLEIREIPLDKLVSNPYQPRKSFENSELEALKQSILQNGIIQPIAVRKSLGDKYEIIAGERRVKACRLASLTHIPAVVLKAQETDAAIFALIENVQRKDLHFFDEARAYESLVREHGYKQKELADRMGKSQSSIANKIRINRLPEEIKMILTDASLTERHARALLRIPDETMQKKILLNVIKKDLSVKETEEQVEYLLCGDAAENKTIRKQNIKTFADIKLFVNSIKRTVQMMKDCGLDPKFTQREAEESIEIELQIPKIIG